MSKQVASQGSFNDDLQLESYYYIGQCGLDLVHDLRGTLTPAISAYSIISLKSPPPRVVEHLDEYLRGSEIVESLATCLTQFSELSPIRY